MSLLPYTDEGEPKRNVLISICRANSSIDCVPVMLKCAHPTGFSTDARTGGQVDHPVNRLPREYAAQKAGVVDVLLVEMKIVHRKQIMNPLFFDGPVVVRIEVVDGIDDVAISQETAAEVPADEAGSAGDEDVHSYVEMVDSICVVSRCIVTHKDLANRSFALSRAVTGTE